MSMTGFNIVSNITWQFKRTTAPFTDIGQGPDGLNFNLNGLDLATFDEAYVAQIILAASTGVEIDLRDLQNLVLEDFGFTQVLALFFLPSGEGSLCNIAPGTPNGWIGPFVHSSSPGINITPGGVFIISGPAVGAGGTEGGGDWAVDGANKNLLLSNIGTAEMTVNLVICGGTAP